MYFEAITLAVKYLGVAVVLLVIAYFASDFVRQTSSKKVLLVGLSICLVFALIRAYHYGSPTCIETDDYMRGACLEYADDSFVPTVGERVAEFIFYVTLLYPAVIAGVVWRKSRE
jgi:hypothetical protein